MWWLSKLMRTCDDIKARIAATHSVFSTESWWNIPMMHVLQHSSLCSSVCIRIRIRYMVCVDSKSFCSFIDCPALILCLLLHVLLFTFISVIYLLCIMWSPSALLFIFNVKQWLLLKLQAIYYIHNIHIGICTHRRASAAWRNLPTNTCKKTLIINLKNIDQKMKNIAKCYFLRLLRPVNMNAN